MGLRDIVQYKRLNDTVWSHSGHYTFTISVQRTVGLPKSIKLPDNCSYIILSLRAYTLSTLNIFT